MNSDTALNGSAENGTVRIVLQDLVYYYPHTILSQQSPDSKPALNHVSFTIYDGEYVAILGANGSGKSTLLKCINGLCVPDAGQVTLFKDGTALDPARPADLYPIRQVIGTLLQNPDDQIVGTVVEEDAAYGPENQGLSEEAVRCRVAKALADTNLTALRTRPPQFLSGGERQRLALSGVLAMETPVLALDEAASMLDEGSRHALMDLLDELWQNGRTILHITHNLEEASRAQRCIVLHKGRLVFNGSPQDLFVHPDLEQWGFRINSAIATVRYLVKHFPGFKPLTLSAEQVAESLAPFIIHIDEQPVPAAPVHTDIAPAQAALVPPSPAASLAALPSPAVQCESLSHTYLAGTAFAATGLESITFSLPAGTRLALIGPSGSGKSTLLRHLNGILLPTGGHVAVFGQNTLDATVDLRTLRQRAVLAVQNPESAQFETYVADEVSYGPRNAGITGKDLVQRVRQAMEMVGLPYNEYRDRLTKELSGGEKRRLALAGILALDGALVLLDEPSAALDGEGQERVIELINLLASQGRTVISSTHSMEEACAHDLVGVLQQGRLIALGTPEEIFTYRWDPSWNLRQPWTVRFSRALEQKLGQPGLFPAETALSAAGLASVLDRIVLSQQQSSPLRPNSQPAETVQPTAPSPSAKLPVAPLQTVKVQPAAPSQTPRPLQLPRRRRNTTGIEFFRNVNLGQFIDTPSRLRDLGAGYKLAATVIILFAVILVPSSVFALAVLGAILVAGKVLGGVGPKHLLRGLIPAAPYILFMVLVQVLFPWPGDTSQSLWHWAFINLSLQKLSHSALLVSRLAALMALLALFSAVTPMVESIKAGARLLAPLERFGIPVQDLILIFGIALRFVPLLVEEAERIVIGQLSRGGGYQGRNKLRSGFALVVPLFLRALERAEVLATAMELRLFSVRSRHGVGM
jgi:energy-coupling factor transport system ATP-binding protein